jgi:hypothetical protein
MRSMTSEGLALLDRIAAGEQAIITSLIYLSLTDLSDTEFYLTTAGRQIDWAGETWFPGGLGRLSPIESQQGVSSQILFILPGVTDQQKSFALESGAEGAIVRVYDALIDPITGQCVDAPLAFSGVLGVPTLQDGLQADLTVEADHRGMLAVRPKPIRYSDAAQRALFPADTSLTFDPRIDAAPLVWPAASFFRK